MSTHTQNFSAVIRSVSAPPALRIDVVGPDPRPVLLLRPPAGWARSSAGPLLFNPRVVRGLTPSHWDSNARALPPIALGALCSEWKHLG